MLSLQLTPVLTVPIEAAREVAVFSFPQCPCGSTFRCLLQKRRHYFELGPQHTCRPCRVRVIRQAIACGFLVLDEA